MLDLFRLGAASNFVLDTNLATLDHENCVKLRLSELDILQRGVGPGNFLLLVPCSFSGDLGKKGRRFVCFATPWRSIPERCGPFFTE